MVVFVGEGGKESEKKRENENSGPPPPITLQLKPFRPPRLFHGDPVLRLGLALLDPELLEEDVGGVEYHGPGAGAGALHPPEAGELRALDALGGQALGVQLGDHVAAELGLGDAGSLEVQVELAADLVAAVEDGDLVGVLAWEGDVGDVDAGAVERGRGGGGSLWHCCC